MNEATMPKESLNRQQTFTILNSVLEIVLRSHD